MGETILTHFGKIDSVDRTQILRYLGIMGACTDDESIASVNTLIDKWYPVGLDTIRPTACFLEADLSIDEDTYTADFTYFSVQSKNLTSVLRGCKKAILVAATLGIKTDMMLKRALVTSKAEALIFNSICVAAIEQYMAELNREFADMYEGMKLRPRFSPGYGDVPLSTQTDLLNTLDSKRKIGVALSDSLLMTPEKSVSAIIGISEDGCMHIDKDCDICSKRDCEYRLS